MKKVLYVDGCINRKTSRTEVLAQEYLNEVIKNGECEVETIILEDLHLDILDSKRLAERDEWVKRGEYPEEIFSLARKVAKADELIIAAPYWDLSFPASVKLFFENICVCGLTFRYTAEGRPEGLTNIRKAVYITTAGGFVGNYNFGFDYVKAVLGGLFSVKNVECFSAEGLDIFGNDPDEILKRAIAEIRAAVPPCN